MSETQTTEIHRYRPRKKAIFGMGLLFFVILAIIALAICNFRVDYAEQSILNQQREIQQAWLDKSLDAIRVWRNELVEQGRFISSSEMFRLFVSDTLNLSPEERARLADPDTLHHPDENLRTLAEQHTYIQDLLKDFTQRRAWHDARILFPDGSTLAAPPFSSPLSGTQLALAEKSVTQGQALFGRIHQEGNQIVMDMADPLYEVLGSAEPKILGILMLNVPIDSRLAGFLARNGEQSETLLPRIVYEDGDANYMALAHAGRISLEPVHSHLGHLENLPFGRREALDGHGEVYSMGAMPTSLNWLYVLETPAAEVDALIEDQKLQIYGLGIFASIGIALLGAWIWAGHTSRKHEAEANRFEELYNTINNQKLILDSINASFKAGLMLVDEYGRVKLSNPAMRAICGAKEDIPPNTPLVECMPPKSAVALLEDMSRVKDVDKSASVEITIPVRNASGEIEDRLYRVTLYPYTNKDQDKAGNPKQVNGCVAVFQDITEFRKRALEDRKKAEDERKRQDALISAFVRAVESVDPNLVGHSDKMTGLSELLSRELELDEAQEKTLALSAKLSQVGKIFVPRNILTKKGKLTEEELKETRRAPEYADKILNDLHFDLPVRETVSLIGERVDGTGKPLGLMGEQISLCGRALAVVNAFIAMTSARAWRGSDDKGMSIKDAIQQLKSDMSFDQNVVDALSRLPHAEIARVIGKKENV